MFLMNFGQYVYSITYVFVKQDQNIANMLHTQK